MFESIQKRLLCKPDCLPYAYHGSTYRVGNLGVNVGM